jgi:hypothetical protein
MPFYLNCLSSKTLLTPPLILQLSFGDTRHDGLTLRSRQLSGGWIQILTKTVIAKTDKTDSVSSVHWKSVGYNLKNSKFEKSETEKTER